MCFHLFLYVLQQEGGGSQIVNWDVEEALNLFLMEVHGDQVGEPYTHTHTHGQFNSVNAYSFTAF